MTRVECQEDCEACRSGHCRAILNLSKPEKLKHFAPLYVGKDWGAGDLGFRV